MVTAFVYFSILVLQSLYSHGHGSEIDRQVCLMLYQRCKTVSYQDCIHADDFNYCSRDTAFVKGILKLYDTNDPISPLGRTKQWPLFPGKAAGPYNEKKQKGVQAEYDYGNQHDASLQRKSVDADYLLAQVVEGIYEGQHGNSNRRREIRRRSSSSSILDYDKERNLLAETLRLKKEIDRQEEERDAPEDQPLFVGTEHEDEGESDHLFYDYYTNPYSPFNTEKEDDNDRDKEFMTRTIEQKDENNLNHGSTSTLKSGQYEDTLNRNDFDSKSNNQVKQDSSVRKISKEQENNLQADSVTTARNYANARAVVAQVSKDSMKSEDRKKDLIFVEVEGNDDIHIIAKSEDPGDGNQDQGHLILHLQDPVNNTAARSFADELQNVLWGIKASKHSVFPQLSTNHKILSLHMVTNAIWFKANQNAKDVANRLNKDSALKQKIKKETGVTVLSADSRGAAVYHHPVEANIADWDQFALITAIVGGCTLGIIVAAVVVCCIKRRRGKGSLVDLKKQEAISDYQELLRTQMSINSSESPRNLKATYDQQRHGLVNGQGKVMRRTWGDEPQRYNMDISTGHVVLAYMEDHLKNEDRLNKEWEVLCRYEADPKDTKNGSDPNNARKNRYADVLPFDHSRVKLKETVNILHSDYINANFITDVDPHNPAYIATQGPLENTIADFWQMVWEQGVVVIVNLTRLSDMGMSQCNRYWPEDGSEVHHIYEIHLISEHIWCDDYLVRSFYLKNIQTTETRTVTQFHFLTWPDLSVPDSPKALLEFRRKVNKCYRGQACPIIVHCNDGVGRTGTYILVDLVLNSMMKGAKEIDIAATLEHLRDQRPDMVKAKAQFEFALAAVAEEVTAILTSLPS